MLVTRKNLNYVRVTMNEVIVTPVVDSLYQVMFKQPKLLFLLLESVKGVWEKEQV